MKKIKIIIASFIAFFLVLFTNINFAQINATANLSGKVYSTTGHPMPNIVVNITSDNFNTATVTNEEGNYNIELPTGNTYTVLPEKDGDDSNGLNHFDLCLYRLQILFLLESDNYFSPYSVIAMDVNNSGSVSTLDIVMLAKLLLFGEFTPLSNLTKSWRFMSPNYSFPNPTDPWEIFPDDVSFNSFHLEVDVENIDFVGIKLGDVDQTADPN